MPDEPPRSGRGHRSDRAGAAGPPGWWAELGRADLPPGEPGTPERPRVLHGGGAHRPRLLSRDRLIRWRGWALNILVLLIGVLVVAVGMGALSSREVLTLGLVFGVPVLVASVSTVVMVRRSRHLH